MKFQLEMTCNNSAFEDDPAIEVGRILTACALKIAQGGVSAGDTWPLFDFNGNRVGQASFEE